MTRASAATQALDPTTHPRICPLCEAHCGTLVTADVASGMIIGVRGDPDDPFSRGYICPKAYAMKELHHDRDIITTPLIKRNGRFEPASWDEALDYTVARLKAVQAEHGREASRSECWRARNPRHKSTKKPDERLQEQPSGPRGE